MNKKHKKRWFWLLSAGLLVMASTPSILQAQSTGKRSLAAVRTDTAPVMDGKVRDDPVWQAVTPTGGFTQTTPDEGQPASMMAS